MPAQKQAPEIVVYFNSQIARNARPISASLGSSAESLPEATIEIQPPGRQPGRSELLGLELAQFDQPEVEIAIRTPFGDQIAHWGKVKARHVVMNEGGDAITFISRIEDQHFGRPLRKAYFWDALSNDGVGLDLPTVFNPEDKDGVVKNNLSAKRDKIFKCGLFVDPESTRTEAARKYAGTPEPKAWTLPEAAYYLCCLLNFQQQYIRNPTLAELKKAFGDLALDESLLRNHEQPFGGYLPTQLDALLSPFGFGWTVALEAVGKRSIRIFKRGDGPTLALRLQSPGETVDVNKSQLENLALTSDVSSGAFNALTVVGDYKRYESTFELKRAWSADHDTRTMDDLTKDNDEWADTPELSRVWRDWVLNEGGDYIGVRDGYDAPYDFNSLFGRGEWVARRREFQPCLTKQNDGTPFGHTGGVFVEWWNDATDEWLPVSNLPSESNQVVVLKHECGIRFNGQEVPWEIRSQKDNAKVRVTAVVESDTRVDKSNDRGATLHADQFRQLLNVGKKFKFDKRSNTSKLKSFGKGTFNDGDFSHDDSQLIDTLSDSLLDRWNVATINGSVTLTGIDYRYTALIGSTINGIDGRRVGFGVSPKDRRFPTVIGARINFLTQQLDLQLDTFRGDRGI